MTATSTRFNLQVELSHSEMYRQETFVFVVVDSSIVLWKSEKMILNFEISESPRSPIVASNVSALEFPGIKLKLLQQQSVTTLIQCSFEHGGGYADFVSSWNG